MLGIRIIEAQRIGSGDCVNISIFLLALVFFDREELHGTKLIFLFELFFISKSASTLERTLRTPELY